MNEVRVHLAGAERLDEIEAIWLSLLEHHLSLDDPELASIRAERQTWTDRRSGFERILRNGDGFMCVAEIHERIVGYIVVDVVDSADNWRIAGDRYADLESIAVLPDVRGAGVGTTLMRAAYRRLRVLGVEEMTTQVVIGNEPARHFYEREGLRAWTVNYLGRVPSS